MENEKKIGAVFTFTMDTGVGSQLSVNGNWAEGMTAEEMISSVEKLRKVGEHFQRLEHITNLQRERQKLIQESTNLEDHLKGVMETEDANPAVVTQLKNAYGNARRNLESVEGTLKVLGVEVDATA